MFPEVKMLCGTPHKRGSALVITLAALVLITAAVLIFFDQSTLNRQIAFSSTGQYRADTVARTALDTIVGDLRTEIVAGSDSSNNVVYTDPNTGLATHLYTPTTKFTTVPCRVGDQSILNLVKQSTALSPAWTGTNYSNTIVGPSPIRSAAGNNTATASTNGRYIKQNRWNKSGLLIDPGTAADPVLPTNYNPPDWVVVTRQGAIASANAAMPTVATLRDKSSGNLNYAVGRYAYAIYNEGALADVNVAGFPSSLSGSPFSTQRGLLPQVDLANIPGVLDANSLVLWRNQMTAQTAASYTNYVTKATNGFTTVAAGDQAFISRKDLIDYVLANPSQASTAALPYLGTSNIDSDQPSFYPDPNRVKVSPTQDDIINPKTASIRVQTAFTRPDGTQAVVGEPLLKHRFPLSRLSLFSGTGGSSSDLQKYFCMKQASDGYWDYVDPDTGATTTTLPTIKTLDQVARSTPGREPTFWELLQAGVLTGSLGQDVTGPAACLTSQNQNPTRQIFSLGLSIIEQYATDGNPITLRFGGPFSAAPAGSGVINTCISGIGNFPYFIWCAENVFRDQTALTSTAVDGYMLFALWNPHRNASTAAPGTFRIVISGQTFIQAGNPTGTPPAAIKTSLSVFHDFPVVDPPTTYFEFQTSASRTFSDIDVLRPTDAVNWSSDMVFPVGAGVPKEVGLFMGTVSIPQNVLLDSGSPGKPGMSINFNQPITIVLEKLVNSNWVPYQVIPYFSTQLGDNGDRFNNITAEMNAGVFAATGNPASMIIDVVHSDPRTTRFGFCSGGSTPVIYTLKNSYNLVYPQSSPVSINQFQPFTTMAPVFSGAYIPADYAYNQASYGTTYQDRDTVVRKGDSNPTSSMHLADSPYYYSANGGTPGNANPVMLNHAFTSVAELGYAFRDDPWRSLNFASADKLPNGTLTTSADGGLLDLFCLNDNKNANRAGVIDVNGASQQVLQALLINAYQDPSAANANPITSAQASTMATAIRSVLGPLNSPTLVLSNVADLPLLIDKVATNLASTLPAPFEFKYNREALARSFADVTNTRTWNLMIDVVAQSGRYGPTAQTLNNFTVEGERRYWIHVALDRFTGEVLRTQTEPVIE